MFAARNSLLTRPAGWPSVWIHKTAGNIISNPEAINLWGLSVVTVQANAVNAPDGSATADFLKETTGNNYHLIYEGHNTNQITANYTYSAWVKPNGRTFVDLHIVDTATWANGLTVRYDLGAKTATPTAYGTGVHAASSITEYPDGWLFLSITGRTGKNSAQNWNTVYLGKDASTFSYAGDVTKGVYLWGIDFRPA